MHKEIIRFNPDHGLMYLIQQTTKQSTDEILGFFFDFGKEVLVEGVLNMSGRSIRKDIRDFYPGTAIPFKLLVKAERRYMSPVATPGMPLWNIATIDITFPDNSMHIKDIDKMITQIIENQILGAAPLPNFEAPKIRTPRMYKDLIKKVLNKNTKTKE